MPTSTVTHIKVGNEVHPIDAVTVNGLTLTQEEKNLWSGKQDALTFDSVPTEDSLNPVTSGGVYDLVTDNELVTAAALNDLDGRVKDLEGFSESDPTVPAWAKASVKPTYTAAEVGALPDTTAIPSVDPYFDGVEYDSTQKRINFKHGSTVKGYLDATAFIKDGMVSGVGISVPASGTNAGVRCLVVTFNTDAGHEDIEIPLTQIFDSAQYYTKTEADSVFVKMSSFDSVPTEDSLNPVTSGGLYTVITDNELVTAAALNDLNDRLKVIEESEETDPVFGASAAAGITAADISGWNSKSTITFRQW